MEGQTYSHEPSVTLFSLFFILIYVSVFVSPIPPPGFLMSTVTPKSEKQQMSKFFCPMGEGPDWQEVPTGKGKVDGGYSPSAEADLS